MIAKNLPEFENGINVSGYLDSDKENNFYVNYFRINNYVISIYDNDKSYSNRESAIIIDLDGSAIKENATHFQKYDLVFSHTVLEHVKNPFLAFSNLEYLLAPNGVLISVVPFIYKFHFSDGDFGDYWRYTPHSLKLLHEKTGLYINLMEVGPSNGYEKYIITVASRHAGYTNFEFNISKFQEWNNTLGKNSFFSLLQNLILRVIDAIKSRYHMLSK